MPVPSETSPNPLLEVSGLEVSFPSPQGPLRVVTGVDLVLQKGQTLGIVGESGCGKSTLALAILRLISPPGSMSARSLRFQGQELLSLEPSHMREIRGRQIALIFQETGASLNPLLKIGVQLTEGLRAHLKVSREEAWQRSLGLLAEVQLPDPEICMQAYPHQLSGGMRQRVLIAGALSCEPSLLIGDEPTTALDVTTQKHVLSLLRNLRSSRDLSMIVISHDLGVIAELADRVAVMYAGQIVECGTAEEVLCRPSHPYTRKLLESLPRLQSSEGLERLPVIAGSVPSQNCLPAGCRFSPRCPEYEESCSRQAPEMIRIGPLHEVRCLRRSPADTLPNARFS